MDLFVFDMGNVFLKGISVLRPMAEKLGIDNDELRSHYALYESAMMDGSMSQEEYYALVGNHFHVKVEDAPLVSNFHPCPDREVLPLVDSIRRSGKRTAVGSNTFAPHWAVVENLPERPLDHFDSLYASHLIHLAKPDPAFWLYICGKEGIQPDRTVFIDDLEENCRAAESTGIKSLHYTGADRLEKLKAFIGECI